MSSDSDQPRITQYGEAFKDRSVAAAYRYRPSYPAETFEILARLIQGEPRRILDVGTGRGDLARNLVERVEQVDALDFSHEMMAQGKQLPNGDHPRLRWLYGRAEDAELHPPYTLITAGQSLHWMEAEIVLPRFRALLAPGGYLATVWQNTTPTPWSILREIVAEYRTDRRRAGRRTPELVDDLEQRGLFQKVGAEKTAPVVFEQSIDYYIESYHGRSGFSRERLGAERAAEFDRRAREILLKACPTGMISLQVVGHVVWGIPGAR